MPARLRGASISVVASFWMIGSVFVALLAWAIIPHFGWRIFVAVCALPAFVCCALSILLLGESPRFLLSLGLVREATTAALKLTGQTHLCRGKFLRRINGVENGALAGRSWVDQISQLLSKRLRRVTLLLCFVTAGMSFGWYGLIMWMPSLFRARNVDMCWNPDNHQECAYQSAL